MKSLRRERLYISFRRERARAWNTLGGNVRGELQTGNTDEFLQTGMSALRL